MKAHIKTNVLKSKLAGSGWIWVWGIEFENENIEFLWYFSIISTINTFYIFS